MPHQWPSMCHLPPATGPDEGQGVILWTGAYSGGSLSIPTSHEMIYFYLQVPLDREAGLALSWTAAMFTKV